MSCYRTIKAKGLIQQLSADEFSSLIRLFGSLSIRDNSPFDSSDNNVAPDFMLHPIVSRLDSNHANDRPHWAFILSLAKEKISQGHVLNNSDNFWMMRAAFADAARFASGEADGALVAVVHYF